MLHIQLVPMRASGLKCWSPGKTNCQRWPLGPCWSKNAWNPQSHGGLEGKMIYLFQQGDFLGSILVFLLKGFSQTDTGLSDGPKWGPLKKKNCWVMIPCSIYTLLWNFSPQPGFFKGRKSTRDVKDDDVGQVMATENTSFGPPKR